MQIKSLQWTLDQANSTQLLSWFSTFSWLKNGLDSYLQGWGRRGKGLIPCLNIPLWWDALVLNVAADMNHHFQKQSFLFFFSWKGAGFWKETKAFSIKPSCLTTCAQSPGNSSVSSSTQRTVINCRSVASPNYDSKRTLNLGGHYWRVSMQKLYWEY